MAHAHCVLDNLGYRHALRICNTSCFSTATMVSRKRLKVSLIRTLSCTLCNATQQHDLSLIEENRENEKFATEWFDVKNKDKPMELRTGKQQSLNSKGQDAFKTGYYDQA